jgi:hypothetical protein
LSISCSAPSPPRKAPPERIRTFAALPQDRWRPKVALHCGTARLFCIVQTARPAQLKTEQKRLSEKKPRQKDWQGVGEKMDQQGEQRSGWSWWYLLFLIQFIAVLWVPFYNAKEPSLAGIPFFYWYQMLWVIIGAILTAIVYVATDA